MGVALAAAKWLGRRGAAFQALILRSALLAVLVCAGLSLGLAGHIHPLFSLSLPAAQVQAISPVPAPAEAPTSAWDSAQVAATAHTVSGHFAEPVGPPLGEPSPAVETHTLPTTIAKLRLSWLYIAGAATWLAGAVTLLFWLLACQIHLFFIARESVPVIDGPAWDALRTLWPQSSNWGPRLMVSGAVRSPFLAGVLRPSIFLPVDFEERFGPDAISLVIAHELCHLRRRDGIWTLLIRLTRSLLWVQPFSWLLERRLLDSFEAICDAEVIAQGKVSASRYADCLVGMAEHLAMPPALRAVGLGVAPFRSSLGKRVQSILSGARSLVQPITPALRMGIAVAAATLALAGVMLVTARIPSHAASAQTPAEVVQTYLDDLSNGQYTQAYALFSPTSKHVMTFSSFLQTRFPLITNNAKLKPEDRSFWATNALFQDPYARMGYRFQVVGPSTDDPNVVILTVYPPGPTLKDSFELGVVTLPGENSAPSIDINETIALIDPNLPQQFAIRSNEAECVNHLKQLALAAIEYAQDHDEFYPDASHWADEIRPYMKDQSAFSDPLDPQVGSWGYAFNRNLSHISMAQLSSPAQTVLFFESTANRKNASDTGQSLAKPSGLNGRYFAFADGHVKLMQDTIRPSFSITPDQANVTIQDLYVEDLASAQPVPNQKVYAQIVDPNAKYQKGNSGFNPPAGSPYLGVQYAPASNLKGNSVIAHAPADIVKSGMIVVRVIPGSPADAAGIQRADIVVEADGKSLAGNTMLLRKLIELHKPGERMSLVVYNHGKSRQITLVVGKAPPAQEQVQTDMRYRLQLVTIQIKLLQERLNETTQELQKKKRWPDKEERVRQEQEALQDQIQALEAEEAALTRMLRHA
jgi:prepilin-type processing-associated H-X9-DG protein